MKRNPFLITLVLVFFLLGCRLTTPRAVPAISAQPEEPFPYAENNDAQILGSELAEGQFLFLARLVDVKGECLSGDCAPGPGITGPAHSWDATNHKLEIYQPGYGIDHNARLVFVDGRTLFGIAGGGFAEQLNQIYDLPAQVTDEITLNRIEADGTLHLIFRDEEILLRSSQAYCATYDEVQTQGKGQVRLMINDCLTNYGILTQADLLLH